LLDFVIISFNKEELQQKEYQNPVDLRKKQIPRCSFRNNNARRRPVTDATIFIHFWANDETIFIHPS
jgi:hypothetical protein